jgi:hypothetical protein
MSVSDVDIVGKKQNKQYLPLGTSQVLGAILRSQTVMMLLVY